MSDPADSCAAGISGQIPGKGAPMHQGPDRNTILIVEDDPNTASLIAVYLEREGFSPVTAATGSGGWRWPHATVRRW